jgi:hypothetical protein
MPSQCRRGREEDGKELESEYLNFKTNTMVSSVRKGNCLQYKKGSIMYYSCYYVSLGGKGKLKMEQDVWFARACKITACFPDKHHLLVCQKLKFQILAGVLLPTM